ncbi:cell division control protein 2 homolog [Prosopis cineraria]|uniref:cell division control protein 2 homolog n=1 Tax=Prosopis cineraria TaxID=364024 RepID=UPI0024103234|nr:cell division control protein 2 homolog [Prosopis cineraria]
MTFNMEIKLADIGFAGSFGDPWTTYPCSFRSRRYSKAADMWSVGCIFGEMITGKPVFQGKTQMDQLKSIFRLLGTRTEESWPRVTEICSRRTLLCFPKFERIMNLAMKFFGFEREGIDLLSKMLCLDPRKRISAANALQHDYFKDFNQRGRAFTAKFLITSSWFSISFTHISGFLLQSSYQFLVCYFVYAYFKYLTLRMLRVGLWQKEEDEEAALMVIDFIHGNRYWTLSEKALVRFEM